MGKRPHLNTSEICNMYLTLLCVDLEPNSLWQEWWPVVKEESSHTPVVTNPVARPKKATLSLSLF